MRIAARSRPSRPLHASTRLAIVPTMVALLLGCAEKGQDAPPPPATQGGASAPPAQPKAVDPATVGGVAGTVEFAGAVPQAASLVMRSEPWCTHQHPGGDVADQKVRVKDGKLAGAFVWIAGGLEGYTFPPSASPVVLDQVGCLFTPRIVGVQVGQPLRLLNSEQVLHNVHAKPKHSRDRNLALPTKGSSREVTFERAEAMVPVVCDVHPWMKAWIGVIDSPFYAVTDEAGAFTLTGLPPGRYVLRVWHEVLGTREQTIEVAPREQLQLSPMVFTSA
jgi:plastocyanin